MIRKIAMSLMMIVGLLGAPLLAAPAANAIDLFGKCQNNAGNQCSVVTKNDLKTSNDNIVLRVMRIVLGALGAISVLMIVIGGIRYTISQGDSSAVASAKNTILYAVIGLVVAMMAGAIVQFVTGKFI